MQLPNTDTHLFEQPHQTWWRGGRGYILKRPRANPDYDDSYFEEPPDPDFDWQGTLRDHQQNYWGRMEAAGVEKCPPECQNGSSRRALDFGCGTGAVAGLLHQNGYKVMGVDTSPEAVAIAKREQTKHDRSLLISPEIDFRVFESWEIFEGENKFDLVVIAHVIEHVKNPIGLLKKLKLLVKPMGMLYIETPLFEEGALAMRSNWREQADHYREFSKKGLRQLCNKTGWIIRKHHCGTDFTPPNPYQYLSANLGN